MTDRDAFDDDFPPEWNMPVPALLPPHRDRIKWILEDNGWSYHVGHDGTVSGKWNLGIYSFELYGRKEEIFCVRGTWHKTPELDDYILATSICNSWNEHRFWPKAYAHIDEEGKLMIQTEMAVSYLSGVTDTQLEDHIHCALSTSETFFEELETKLPHAHRLN